MIMYPALAKQPLLTYFSISYILLTFFFALHYAHLEVCITGAGSPLQHSYFILAMKTPTSPSLFKASKSFPPSDSGLGLRLLFFHFFLKSNLLPNALYSITG